MNKPLIEKCEKRLASLDMLHMMHCAIAGRNFTGHSTLPKQSLRQYWQSIAEDGRNWCCKISKWRCTVQGQWKRHKEGAFRQTWSQSSWKMGQRYQGNEFYIHPRQMLFLLLLFVVLKSCNKSQNSIWAIMWFQEMSEIKRFPNISMGSIIVQHFMLGKTWSNA